ncbi:MAG: hypothetical protein HY512_01740, partial [Candidatus Aenigmarchaeota archaeon]|nr:hypothetical protein [Candidatus Aenigmarchaeota archaeon]
KNKGNIFDIVLLGSSVKGKTKPEDTDITVIFNQSISQEKIHKIIKLFKGTHTEYVFLKELYKETLWPTIIQEGYSLIHAEFIHKLIGFNSGFLFVYDLKSLEKSSKSRFSHALFGRADNEGLLYELKGKQLGRGCISVPTENSEKIRSFFETWKTNYSVYRTLLY